MEYFKNCDCIEELKKQYKKLCFKYHPDISKEANANGTMKKVNSEYDELFDKLKNVFKNQKGKVYTNSKPVSETPEEFRNIINALIGLEGIEVELIGRWIWVIGNTKPHKQKLKELNFRWCKKKVAWSWHRAEDSTISKGNYTLSEIREKYGSTTYKKSNMPEIEAKAS